MRYFSKRLISYSSPAKVILSGEHSVVFGKPALVTAINLRLKVSIWPGDFQNTNNPLLIIESFVKKYLSNNKNNYHPQSFGFKIDSQIPVGRGLGSSAALACAATAAILALYTQKPPQRSIINEIAYGVEKYFHHTPSGVDNSTSCLGGLIFYRKEFDFLKNISPLHFDIPSSIGQQLFLIDSGKPTETTAEMVKFVKHQVDSDGNYKQILLDIEEVTKEMVIAIKDNNFDNFKKTIVVNEDLLEKLGVVSKATKHFLGNLGQYGVGKITGAGGITGRSGYILFLASHPKKLLSHLKKHKIPYFRLIQDKIGIKNEKTS